MLSILKRKAFWFSLPLVLTALMLVISPTLRQYLFYFPSLSAGVAAKLACSGVYVSGRTPKNVITRDLLPFNPIMKYITLDFNPDKKTVTATMLGLKSRTALYRDGVGCLLLVTKNRKEMLRQSSGLNNMMMTPRPEQWPQGDKVILSTDNPAIDWTRLTRAVTGAFEDNTPDKTIDTRAILVVYDGKIIAEKYAAGFNKNSRFLSWSMAKSVTGALIGLMVKEGKLTLDGPAPVAEWANKKDPRHNISLNDLLTMSSGLAFSESYRPGDDGAQMLFNSSGMADYAASKTLYQPPGTFWSYSSGTANILARILREQAGGGLKDVQNFARNQFFLPLGMTSVIFEADEQGNFVGSSYLYATARDWARFGLLYLNQGQVGNRHILTKNWIEYSRHPAPMSPDKKYGALFWLTTEAISGIPQDMYMANGSNGQLIAIIPSRKTVIIRLGWRTGKTRFDRNKHFAEILKALPDEGQK